jgi:hypothetical protein
MKQRSWVSRKQESPRTDCSFAPLGLVLLLYLPPTACAVGFIPTPLRG